MALPADLLEEIFLRLPPDEPEWLVRASLTSKLWLGRLSAPRFHARYREFHRAPPMLGFFYPSLYTNEEPPFVSTTKFRLCIAGYSAYETWDCRHGCLLLGCCAMYPEKLVVLDPITGCRRELVTPGYYNRFGAAVLCAVNGCDHRACHGGPSRSRVVIVGLDGDASAGFTAYAYETLPETGERSSPQWSKPSSGLHLGPDVDIKLVPPVLIKDTLYFKLAYAGDDQVGILQYDLCSKRLSLIDAPLAKKYILMGMHDGSLGFAHLDLDGLTLSLWSRKIGSDGVGSWNECRVIDLEELIPFPVETLRLVGSLEGGDVIFVAMIVGTYEINLKSLECKIIWELESRTLIPYMSFYHPQGRSNPCDAAL